MSSSNWVLQVEFLDGSRAGESLLFDEKKIKVGKLSTSQIHLEDESVSRIHAMIEDQGDGTYLVIDLGSTSGTFVNGAKITKEVLRGGDQIGFGSINLQVNVLTPAQADAARAAAIAALKPVVPEGHILLEDNSVVQPYTLEGYYDDAGNYIPGFYDNDGKYHYGYGFHDENGKWKVAHGFYDPEGEWVPTEAPAGARLSDTEVYTENFFNGSEGNVLEVAFLWTDQVLNVQSFKKPQSITIGGDREATYVVEDPILPAGLYELVSYNEQKGYALHFLPQMEGMLKKDGHELSLTDAIERGLAAPGQNGTYSIPLIKGTSVRLDFGPNTFLLHFSQIPVVAGGAFAVEKAPLFYLGVSAGLHLAFMLLVFMLPDNFGGFELHDFAANDRFVELMTPPEQEEEEEDLDWLDDAADSAAAEDDEGIAGQEEAVEVDMEMAIEGEADPEDMELQRERDMEIASEAGALAVFNEMPFGGADDPLGAAAMNALGALNADHAGAALGAGGLGLTDGGRGGGGNVEGGFGTAAVGTRGMSRGTGVAPGASLEEREFREPIIVPGEPAITGSLDREIIQRVVRQHRREMTHCYEQELRRNPSLEGRVVMTWVIAANGSVVTSSVSETTLNNRNVENCMAQRIRRWVFPEPDGGGIVRVNYPFNFSS